MNDIQVNFYWVHVRCEIANKFDRSMILHELRMDDDCRYFKLYVYRKNLIKCDFINLPSIFYGKNCFLKYFFNKKYIKIIYIYIFIFNNIALKQTNNIEIIWNKKNFNFFLELSFDSTPPNQPPRFYFYVLFEFFPPII